MGQAPAMAVGVGSSKGRAAAGEPHVNSDPLLKDVAACSASSCHSSPSAAAATCAAGVAAPGLPGPAAAMHALLLLLDA